MTWIKRGFKPSYLNPIWRIPLMHRQERDFFVFSANPSRTDLQWIVRQEWGGFDSRLLRRVRMLEPNSLTNAKFFVNDNPPTDLVPNPNGVCVASARLVKILSDLIPAEEVQILNAPLFSQTTALPVPGYFVIHALRIVPALTERCARGNQLIDQLEIEDNKVSENAHFFRLAERPAILVVSNLLLELLTGKGLQGLIPIPIRTVVGPG